MFLNSVMLAGIAGAALPLMVHLLSRARVRTVDWGAMMFLDEGHGTQEQMAKLKQWTLLALRMAIVALLAIAMARPIASANWAGPTGPLTAIIAIDCSASMAQPTDGGRTRSDLTREAALRTLSSLQKGDRAALILAGARQVIVPPTTDLQAIAARVAEIKPTTGAADIAAALNEAVAMLDRSSSPNAHLYLFTDAQASNWQGVDDAFQASWKRRTVRAGRTLPFDVITVGDGRNAENIAIETISVAPIPAIAGLSNDVELKLRHSGSSSAAVSKVPLTLKAAKQTAFSGTVDLTSNAVTTITVPVRFDAPGQQTLVAQITSATLAFDDRLQHVVDVVPPLRVLIISGDERTAAAGAFRNESDFLRTALTPYATMKRGGIDSAKVTVTPVEKWTDPSLPDTDVLVIANVAELTPQQVRAVESFTYAGGGVLIAPGAATRVESYNRTLYRDATGPLPAFLLGPSSDQPTSLLGIDLSHPIFRFLRGRPAPIPSAVVARMFTATPRAGAAVLASYVTGQPFLVEGAYGRGRVLLMTTTIDADWNTLPLSSFYLPFVQSAVRYLAAAALPQRNLIAGQELRARLADAPEAMRATLTYPGGRTITLQATGGGGGGGGGAGGAYEVATGDTQVPGSYTVRAKIGGHDRVEQFAVRPDPGESNLAPLDDERTSTLEQSLGFQLTGADMRTPVVASVQPVRELWLPLLLGAFSLLVVELVLTRFWSEGRHA
jgi:hypothetical protein